MEIKQLHNEQELLQRTAAGDEQAFTELFRHYHPVIYHFVLHLSGSETIAEEIVQDSFLKAWLKRETLPFIGNFGGWLYTVASNTAYDALRTLDAHNRLIERLTASGKHALTGAFISTETLLQEKEYGKLLQDALNTLPEQQRVAYRLIKEQYLTREQAARKLAVSPESVKTNLAMAMQKIRAYCLLRLKI